MAKSKKEETLMDQAEDKIEDLKNKYQEYRHGFVDYVQKNPFSTMAIALAAGVLLGTYWTATHIKK